MASFRTRDIEVEAHAGRTVESEFFYYAKHERAYIDSEELTNPDVGDTAALSLTNPAGSGVSAIMEIARATPSAPSIARIYDRFDDPPEAGDTDGIDNVLLDTDILTDDVGAVTTAVNPTYTPSGTPHAVENVGGGRGSGAVGGNVNAPVLIVEPDRQIVLEVEKLVNDGETVPLTFRWFEVPVVYSEESPDPPIDEVTRL